MRDGGSNNTADFVAKFLEGLSFIKFEIDMTWRRL